MTDPRALYSPGTGRGAAAILPDNGQQIQNRIASEIERRRRRRKEEDAKKEKEQNAFLRKVKAGLPKSPDGAYLGDLDNLYTMRKAIEEYAVDAYMNGDDPFAFGTDANKKFRLLQQGYEKAIQYSKERAKNVNKYASYYEQNRDKLDEETMANLNEYKDLPLEDVPKWNKPFVVDKAPEFNYSDLYKEAPSLTLPGKGGAVYFNKAGAEKWTDNWLQTKEAEPFKNQYGNDAKNVMMDILELKAKDRARLPRDSKQNGSKITPDMINKRESNVVSAMKVIENGMNPAGLSAMSAMVGGTSPRGGKITKVYLLSPRAGSVEEDWNKVLAYNNNIDKSRDYIIVEDNNGKTYPIDLTDPTSYNTIHNIYNTVPGNTRIPIDGAIYSPQVSKSWWDEIK